jgi:hypothetical protein
MKNEHDEAKKWMVGLLIGGVVGAGALYCIRAVQNRQTPVLKKVGKTISNLGEIIENFDAGDVAESIEKKMPSGADVISSLSDWVDSGMQLWKKFKKG